ncbi:hypothetical protein SEVIR_6G041801v4 [Setaria viridis]
MLTNKEGSVSTCCCEGVSVIFVDLPSSKVVKVYEGSISCVAPHELLHSSIAGSLYMCKTKIEYLTCTLCLLRDRALARISLRGKKQDYSLGLCHLDGMTCPIETSLVSSYISTVVRPVYKSTRMRSIYNERQ